eukprot:5542905-Prymnesium_polylepis.1
MNGSELRDVRIEAFLLKICFSGLSVVHGNTSSSTPHSPLAPALAAALCGVRGGGRGAAAAGSREGSTAGPGQLRLGVGTRVQPAAVRDAGTGLGRADIVLAHK